MDKDKEDGEQDVRRFPNVAVDRFIPDESYEHGNDRVRIIGRGSGFKTEIYVGNQKMRYVTDLKINVEPAEPITAVITVKNVHLDIDLDKEMTEWIMTKRRRAFGHSLRRFSTRISQRFWRWYRSLKHSRKQSNST